MGVRIDQINVENAGPIRELQLTLGPFNLIYGRNERGKTFLAEFVIRSLFKNLSGWSLRHFDGRGNVVVSGLDNSPLVLAPATKDKLEDHLATSEPGLPAQIGRLLVVKGADLSFEDSAEPGINHRILKEFLSGQGVLDNIEDRISKTVQKATIENGQIIGHNMGELKHRNSLAADMAGLEELFERFEAVYSGGERQQLRTKAAELERQVENLEAAKRHRAYQLDQQFRELEGQVKRLPEGEIGQLAEDFSAYLETKSRIGRRQKQIEDLATKSEHHEWLELAIPLYEQRAQPGKAGTGIIFPFLILVFLLLAIVASFLNFPLGTFVLVALAAVLGWLYWRQMRRAMKAVLDVDEINRLEAEFERRFGRPLSGLPLIQETLRGTAEAYHGAKTQRADLVEEQQRLAELHDQVSLRLQTLTGVAADPEEWNAAVQALRDKQKDLSAELAELRLALVALGVDTVDYREEPADENYDPIRLQAIQAELAEAEADLAVKTAELDGLRLRICQETKDDADVDWGTLIRNLQDKREKLAAEYRTVTAQIAAGIVVNGVLEKIRDREDDKIRQKLASPQVSKPIQRITRRYTGVKYGPDGLTVADAYDDFPIAELSTGAREQVLLALRLGFAAQILGHDRLFLLLDDAFQHADWERRVRLMDQMVSLARDGWQIIYFTMDDHIKRLFDAAGSHIFGEEYAYYDLNMPSASR